MSIEKLDALLNEEYIMRQVHAQTYEVFIEICTTLKDQSDMIADLQQQLAQKEDAIDYNNIKGGFTD